MSILVGRNLEADFRTSADAAKEPLEGCGAINGSLG